MMDAPNRNCGCADRSAPLAPDVAQRQTMGPCDAIDRTGIVDLSEVLALHAHRRTLVSRPIESKGSGCIPTTEKRPRWTLDGAGDPDDDREGGCDNPDETPPIDERDLPPPGSKEPAPVLCEEDRAEIRRLVEAIRRTRLQRSPGSTAISSKAQDFPQANTGPGCATDRAAPFFLNQEICVTERPPLDVDTMLLPNALPIAEDCLDAIWAAWITINRVLACTTRIQFQWWHASGLPAAKNPSDFLGTLPFGIDPTVIITQIAKLICLAGARLTGGVSYDGTTPPRMQFIPVALPCGGDVPDVRILGDGIVVCSGWPTSAGRPRTTLTAALLTGALEVSLDIFEVARWIHARHEEFSNLKSTAFTEWDLRPDASRIPMLERYHRYEYVVTKDWERDRIRRAWDGSWLWVEAGWRFLYRAGLIYRALAESDGKAAAEQALHDLWRMGGDHDEIGAVKPYNGPRGTSRGTLDNAYSNAEMGYSVSLETWFGPYSNARFLTVWWTVTALASRYQNRYPNEHMSTVMWHTKFHAVRWGKRPYSHPTGEIWLRNDFFKYEGEKYRHQAICHEMLHFLVKSTNGGRPRDIYNPACTDGDNHKCYGDKNAVMLAATGDWEALKNVDNYSEWLFRRYLRWRGDWPPSSDAAPADPYVEDPISDAAFIENGLGEPRRVSWVLLEEVRNLMFGSDWEPFGF